MACRTRLNVEVWTDVGLLSLIRSPPARYGRRRHAVFFDSDNGNDGVRERCRSVAGDASTVLQRRCAVCVDNPVSNAAIGQPLLVDLQIRQKIIRPPHLPQLRPRLAFGGTLSQVVHHLDYLGRYPQRPPEYRRQRRQRRHPPRALLVAIRTPPAVRQPARAGAPPSRAHPNVTVGQWLRRLEPDGARPPSVVDALPRRLGDLVL